MRKVKEGECPGALHRNDIGSIDLETEIKQLGFEIEDFVPIVVQYGELKEKKSVRKKPKQP